MDLKVLQNNRLFLVFMSQDVALALHVVLNKSCTPRRWPLRRFTKSAGTALIPPLGDVERLGPLVPKDVTVDGESWRESAMDISFAGHSHCLILLRAFSALWLLNVGLRMCKRCTDSLITFYTGVYYWLLFV